MKSCLPLLLALALPPAAVQAGGVGVGQLPSSRPAAPASSIAGQPVYLEASVEPAQGWVNAQMLLTIRVLHRVPLYDDSHLQLTPLEDLRLQSLGAPHTYETRIGEQRHGVIEYRYALFAQRSGSLQLPPLQFSATALLPGESGQPASARRLQLATPPLQLQIQPPPADYPPQQEWLPASALSLSEQWLPGDSEVQVGTSLTRRIRIQASGMPASLLPEIITPPAAGVLQYREQPRLQDSTSPAGSEAQREDSLALVFTQPGLVELPAVELPWWNTRSGQLEIARLPARSIHVLPELSVSTSPLSPPALLPGDSSPPPLWPWQLATALLTLSSLTGFALWWHARRQPAISRSPAGPSQRNLLESLRRQCNANDPQAARQALDAWARQQPETLARMAARDIALSAALDELNVSLYGQGASPWDGKALWQAISRLAASNDTTAGQPGSLPPLYPR